MTMRVEIRPINLRGKALKKAERDALAPVCGKLKVFENRLHALGRTLLCARVLSVSDGLETDLLPELLDAQLLWLDDKAIRLRGVEQVDGTSYGQTWDIKVL